MKNSFIRGFKHQPLHNRHLTFIWPLGNEFTRLIWTNGLSRPHHPEGTSLWGDLTDGKGTRCFSRSDSSKRNHHSHITEIHTQVSLQFSTVQIFRFQAMISNTSAPSSNFTEMNKTVNPMIRINPFVCQSHKDNSELFILIFDNELFVRCALPRVPLLAQM